MSKVVKIISRIAFVIFLYLGYFVKGVTHFLSIAKLKIQEKSFNRLKKNVLTGQHDELRRLNDENTRRHLVELANILRVESNKYQHDVGTQDFSRLRKMIDNDVKNMNLKNLTKLYNIFFETPKIDILNKLDKLIKKRC